MFTKLWERYFFREIAKIFFFFMIGFLILYILIDFSSRHGAYRNIHLHSKDILFYYAYIIIQRWEILIPFALLIATIKTLCSLNVNNELVSLMASGIPLKTLMRPFLVFTLLITSFLYFNTEYLIPASTNGLKKFHQVRFKEKYKREKKQNIHSISLTNHMTLLYHSFDPEERLFSDVFWIRKADDIYRMKCLSTHQLVPRGTFVDHFTRNQKGQLIISESFADLEFPEIQMSQEKLRDVITSPSDLSISQLWNKQPFRYSPMTDREAALATSFFRKLAMPWLSLLTFMAVAPFCLQFTRKLPIFLLYLSGMIGLVAFYFIINACNILGENQVMNPFWAIGFPFLLLGSIVIGNYMRMR